MNKKVPPRTVAERDSKYMGLAWLHAGFSKDPSTQVGAQLVDDDNYPLGSGYNGPPRNIKDDSFSWERPPKDDPDAFSKYDVVIHAEHNAIIHSRGKNLRDATMYVTALPCPRCMNMMVAEGISRVVYFDFQSNKGSCLQNDKWRDKSFQIAALGKMSVEKFDGNINWIRDWVEQMRLSGIFDAIE